MTGGLAGFACESNHLPDSVAGGKKERQKGRQEREQQQDADLVMQGHERSSREREADKLSLTWETDVSWNKRTKDLESNENPLYEKWI